MICQRWRPPHNRPPHRPWLTNESLEEQQGQLHHYTGLDRQSGAKDGFGSSFYVERSARGDRESFSREGFGEVRRRAILGGGEFRLRMKAVKSRPRHSGPEAPSAVWCGTH